MSAPISQEHRSRLIASMSTWDFRPHKLQEADVFRCTCLIFEAVLRIDGLHQLGINRDRLHRFLFALRAIYHSPNPYHNYIHALDVVQSSYTFMVQIGVAPHLSILDDGSEGPWHRPEFPEAMDIGEDNARQYSRSILRPQDVLAVMIAAMGHDVGHPGLSNAFMVSTRRSRELIAASCDGTDEPLPIGPNRKTQRRHCLRCIKTSQYWKTCTACSSFGSSGSMALDSYSALRPMQTAYPP